MGSCHASRGIGRHVPCDKTFCSESSVPSQEQLARNMAFRDRLPTRPSRTPPQVATSLVAPGTAYAELKIYASRLLEYGLEKLAQETVAKYENGETHEALAGKLFDRKTSVPRDPASAEQIDFNAGQTNNQYLLTFFPSRPHSLAFTYPTLAFTFSLSGLS